MSRHTFAAEIARRRQELAADSAENVEAVVLGLLAQHQLISESEPTDSMDLSQNGDNKQ